MQVRERVLVRDEVPVLERVPVQEQVPVAERVPVQAPASLADLASAVAAKGQRRSDPTARGHAPLEVPFGLHPD